MEEQLKGQMEGQKERRTNRPFPLPLGAKKIHQELKKYIQISEAIRLFVIEYWIVCNILFANISWHMLIYFLERGQQIYLDPISSI